MKKLLFSIIVILLGLFQISGQPFNTQLEWEQYFKNRIQNLDPIEGIWNMSLNTNTIFESSGLQDKVSYPNFGNCAVYKVGNEYLAYDLVQDGSTPESIKSFMNTAADGVYLVEIYYLGSSSTAKTTGIMTSNTLIEFNYNEPNKHIEYILQGRNTYGFKATIEYQWIKIFPKQSDYASNEPSSGSGFAISTNGIIVTNYHVIDGASSVKVRGVNSDFNKTYNAKILVSDKNNDLALIQIDDYAFTSITGTIPYVIKASLSGVGESVFVLGYPLRATMGDEIKLTNGIISSKTGFQGDISSYQISAPVQPGNSGGPLFDTQGNVTGIVNAKHAEAENASYAVKSSYLMNLIELLPTPPKLQTTNTLAVKTLVQQVEIVKRFVYIIEVN